MAQDYAQAKTSLAASISANKSFLAQQSDPSTLAQTFAALDAIDLALRQWCNAAISAKAMTASTEQEISGALASASMKEILTGAAKLSGYIAELRLIVADMAARARLANGS